MRISLLLAIGLMACACGHASPTPTHQPVATKGAFRHEAGIPVALPLRAKSSKDVDPVTALGQDIFITDTGFRPKSLIAAQAATIYFTNETSSTQTVKFTNWPWTSPPIAPGKTVTYKPTSTATLDYELVSNTKYFGDIEVEPWKPEEGNVPPQTATPQP
jgi:hypothetical protein